jgi:single-strand DNA-binding protein
MAGSVNKVILVGHMGKDPEVRTFQNGNRVCNFSLATGESWKDKQTGERRQSTEWHNVVVTNESLVGVAEKYLEKGAKIYIEGKIKTRKYTDKSGVDKYTTEIMLEPFHGVLVMLDGKDDNAASSPHDHDGQHQQSGAATKAAPARDLSQDDLDDSIPF